MHNGMLEMRGEKMSKSLGNISLLPEVLEQWGRDALLVFFAGGHYRQPIVFAPDTLAAAAARAQGIREAGRRLVDGPSPADLVPVKERFFEALADDFNTVRAMAAVNEWTREANRRDGVGRDDLVEMLSVLALENLLAPEDAAGPDDEALELLRRRDEARAARDFAAADALRDDLRARGWEVRDGPGGAELVRS
jgi:cysteinyl-tRNA synthetase